MFEGVVNILQWIAGIWLAMLVIYSILGESAARAAERNAPDPYSTPDLTPRATRAEMSLAAVVLVLTLIDLMFYLA